MRKLLASPVNMSLSDNENQIYQTALKHAAEISLNLMAVKVENRPEDFLSWCNELNVLCSEKLNQDLLEPAQFVPLKKLQASLATAISMSQIKMLRIAPWPIFVEFIQNNATNHALEERLALTDYIAGLNGQPLAEMIEEDRLAFAGKHTAKHDISIYKFDVEWFGATKGAKIFHKLLQQVPGEFDKALAEIPVSGNVDRQHYLDFVAAYKAIFAEHAEGETAPLAAATRLLAMRRPDQFIPLTNAKIDGLCQGLSIPKFNNRNFEAYWDNLIETMMTCAWWRRSAPEDEGENKLWQIRSLLVDLFFYADESVAAGSNYIRLRDKPAKARSASAGSRKYTARTKESAESLVDKALAADDLPDYLQSKRESIITEVKKGKSVDEVVKLIRTIFG